VVSFIRRFWFLMGLLGVVAAGFLFCEPLKELPEYEWLQQSIVVVVLFLMAFPLSFGDIKASLGKPLGALLGTAMNCGVLPILAWIASLLASGDMAIGINLMAAIPCTLASAAVWTRRAGGNDTIALMVTVITNSLCFLIIPFWLYFTTGSGLDISVLPDPDSPGFSLVEMMTKLLMLVVLPMVVGQIVRLSGPAANWATSQKPILGIIAQAGILSMVLLGCIRCGIQLKQLPPEQLPGWENVVWIGILTLSVHISTLFLGVQISKWIGLAKETEIAVAFGGSQKTLMVGLAIASQFYSAFPLAILPMIIFHVGQLFFDTYVADRYRAAAIAKLNI